MYTAPRLVPRPSHLHANIHTQLIFTLRKVGRSCQFGDVMVTSRGCGLNFLDTHCSLPMEDLSMKLSAVASFPGSTQLFNLVYNIEKLGGAWGRG